MPKIKGDRTSRHSLATGKLNRPSSQVALTFPRLFKQKGVTVERLEVKRFIKSVRSHFPALVAFWDNVLGDTSRETASTTTVRHAFSHPTTFVRLILRDYLPSGPYESLSDVDCDNLYGEFCTYVYSLGTRTTSGSVSRTNSSTTIYELITSLREQKKYLESTYWGVLFRLPWKMVYIHFVHPVPCEASKNKQVVLDCPNEKEFPSAEYYHLASNSCLRISPSNNTDPEIHLLIDTTENPPSEDDIRNRVTSHIGSTLTSEPWFVGCVAYNIFEGNEELKAQLAENDARIKENLRRREIVDRGNARKGTGKLVGLGGNRIDQNGKVGPWRNFQRSVPNPEKLDLDVKADAASNFFSKVFLVICTFIDREVVKALLPEIVKDWSENTKRQLALATSVGTRIAVTVFAMKQYSPRVHTDSKESKWTVGIRTERGLCEHDNEYQFVYTTLKHGASSLPGVIIDQPTGTVTLWQGGRYPHGSSLGLIDEGESYSTGLVMTQKTSMLKATERHHEMLARVS